MCGEIGIHHFFLDDLPNHGRELVRKAFLQSYRWAKFDGKGGAVSGRRSQPRAASTLTRAAASSLATTLLQTSPQAKPLPLQGKRGEHATSHQATPERLHKH
jgi:hypothetical protein